MSYTDKITFNECVRMFGKSDSVLVLYWTSRFVYSLWWECKHVNVTGKQGWAKTQMYDSTRRTIPFKSGEITEVFSADIYYSTCFYIQNTCY